MTDWVLLHKRRHMGRVTPDNHRLGMYRVVLSRGQLGSATPVAQTIDTWCRAFVLHNTCLVPYFRQ
jgi:hypothetical protein